MDFEKWLTERGLDPNALNDETRAIMMDIYKREQNLLDEARRTAANGEPAGSNQAAARNTEQLQARTITILGAARAAGATADDRVRADLLGYAAELVSDQSVRAEDAVGKIAKRATELVHGSTGDTTPADDAARSLPGQVLVQSDPGAVLSRREIVSAYTDQVNNRTAREHAARSVVDYMERGDEIELRGLLDDIRDRDPQGNLGRIRIHDERGGRPTVRTVTASAINVTIQSILTYLLNHNYEQNPPVTDPLVTVIPSSAAEDTLPEVETEEGVRRVKEGESYPLISGSERDVKVGYFKFGAAIAQTRENAIFDRLGRVSVHLTSLARQLRNKRDQFRLARICDSTAFDGRYIARPGNDAGSAAFYSASADHRGNVNLKASNALADETDIDNVVQILENMKLLDGSYVMGRLRVLLVDSSLKATAWKIVNSMFTPSVTYDSGNFMTPNPYGPGGLLSEVPKIISHALVGTYAGATTTWFAGDPAQQFYEKEVWPVEVVPHLTEGEMALRDIVGLWIGSFCCDLVALSNMYMIKNTA